MDLLEERIAYGMTRWVRVVTRHARRVLLFVSLATIGLIGFAAVHLGVNSDNVTLIAEHLEARQNYLEFARSFPNIENVMLIVVDGETPEIARNATTRLQAALDRRDDLFHDVYIPGAGDYFERHGLLYRDLDDLDEFGYQIARVQPILTALEREPTVANLASLIQIALEESEDADETAEELALLLDRVGDATVEAFREFPLEISWEEILLRGSSVDTVKQWVIITDPVLDFRSIFSAARPMSEIRRIAAEEGLDERHGIRVRLTGNPVLNLEEMVGILWDIGMGGVICFFVVLFVLMRAFRSFRLVLAAVITLLVGLVWTGAFAAASVGDLNLISVAFAILFIGLGVDFTIHLGMAYVDALRRRADDSDAHEAALEAAIERVGPSLAICTLTTATGFYVFIPTDNIGVAELGLIAGTGMVLNLLLTTTLFPALLTVGFRLDPKRDVPRAMHFRNPWWLHLLDRPGWIAGIALVLFGVGIWKAVDVRFDANVVRMRDQDTESVQVFNELLEEAGPRSPWPVDTIAPDLETAIEIARQVETLDVVESAVTIADYVPTDQEEKLMILEDVGMILDAPRNAPAHSEAPDTAEQIEALRTLRDFLADPAIEEKQGALAMSMRTLRSSLDDFLARADEGGHQDNSESFARLESVLLGGLTEQLSRLREATFIEEVTLEDLPVELRNRMLTPDGRARVQIFPAEKLSDERAFTAFAKGVQTIVPNATGLPINLIAFADATRDSFSEALTYAIVLIATFLFALWRRVAPVMLVLAPLLLSNVVTVALMATFGIAFNFANCVVIPLLLGIGVDSGIHLVHRAESQAAESPGEDPSAALLSSTTARAVFYSAFTTTVSFGTLSLSSHLGISSLGVVLSAGMVLTVLSNLLFLPALLVIRARRSRPN